MRQRLRKPVHCGNTSIKFHVWGKWWVEDTCKKRIVAQKPLPKQHSAYHVESFKQSGVFSNIDCVIRLRKSYNRIACISHIYCCMWDIQWNTVPSCFKPCWKQYKVIILVIWTRETPLRSKINQYESLIFLEMHLSLRFMLIWCKTREGKCFLQSTAKVAAL